MKLLLTTGIQRAAISWPRSPAERASYHAACGLIDRSLWPAAAPQQTRCRVRLNVLGTRSMFCSSRRNGRDEKDDARAPTRRLPATHYELFPKSLSAGPPPAGPFALDTTALRREFLQLQAKAHPDLHPPALKARAEATSARINEAYRTLRDPLARAQYLLARRGLDVATDETAQVHDAALLTDVLAAREEIEAAREPHDLSALRCLNEARVRACEGALARAFAADDLRGAGEEAVKLRYWVNIRESLREWERGEPGASQH